MPESRPSYRHCLEPNQRSRRIHASINVALFVQVCMDSGVIFDASAWNTVIIALILDLFFFPEQLACCNSLSLPCSVQMK